MQSPKYILHIQELPVPEGVTRRCSVKKSSEKRVKIKKTQLQWRPSTSLKKGALTNVFLWTLEIFSELLFYGTPVRDAFRTLSNIQEHQSWKPLNVFPKGSILNVLQGSYYASDLFSFIHSFILRRLEKLYIESYNYTS